MQRTTGPRQLLVAKDFSPAPRSVFCTFVGWREGERERERERESETEKGRRLATAVLLPGPPVVPFLTRFLVGRVPLLKIDYRKKNWYLEPIISHFFPATLPTSSP